MEIVSATASALALVKMVALGIFKGGGRKQITYEKYSPLEFDKLVGSVSTKRGKHFVGHSIEIFTEVFQKASQEIRRFVLLFDGNPSPQDTVAYVEGKRGYFRGLLKTIVFSFRGPSDITGIIIYSRSYVQSGEVVVMSGGVGENSVRVKVNIGDFVCSYKDIEFIVLTAPTKTSAGDMSIKGRSSRYRRGKPPKIIRTPSGDAVSQMVNSIENSHLRSSNENDSQVNNSSVSQSTNLCNQSSREVLAQKNKSRNYSCTPSNLAQTPNPISKNNASGTKLSYSTKSKDASGQPASGRKQVTASDKLSCQTSEKSRTPRSESCHEEKSTPPEMTQPEENGSRKLRLKAQEQQMTEAEENRCNILQMVDSLHAIGPQSRSRSRKRSAAAKLQTTEEESESIISERCMRPGNRGRTAKKEKLMSTILEDVSGKGSPIESNGGTQRRKKEEVKLTFQEAKCAAGIAPGCNDETWRNRTELLESVQRGGIEPLPIGSRGRTQGNNKKQAKSSIQELVSSSTVGSNEGTLPRRRRRGISKSSSLDRQANVALPTIRSKMESSANALNCDSSQKQTLRTRSRSRMKQAATQKWLAQTEDNDLGQNSLTRRRSISLGPMPKKRYHSRK